MRTWATGGSVLGLALLPVLFMASGRHWQMAVVLALIALPLLLALAALHVPPLRALRIPARVLNLLAAAVGLYALIAIATRGDASAQLLSEWEVLAGAFALAVAPVLNLLALARRPGPPAAQRH